MSGMEQIPNFKYINTEIGLKFLNSNEKLYIKILKSFLDRYEHIEITSLTMEELKSVVHTIKGLSATLGMEKIHELCLSELTEPNILELEKSLLSVITELKESFSDS